jgi:hypothetical protein
LIADSVPEPLPDHWSPDQVSSQLEQSGLPFRP